MGRGHTSFLALNSGGNNHGVRHPIIGFGPQLQALTGSLSE